LTNVLGVIPARGGSKGIPRKNLVPLGGKPLIAYTCEAALGSRRLARTIVSTDDRDIAAAAGRAGVEAPFLRPAHLAADDTPMIDVLRDVLDTLTRTEGYVAEAVVLLSRRRRSGDRGTSMPPSICSTRPERTASSR
jgi:CMP-N-acetylneuraminic acid synthetase